MSVQRESQKERYDAVVVGAGMGGLSAGAILARAGMDVLVVERHSAPGGYTHGFRRRQLHFDAGAHIVNGAEPVAFGWGAIVHDMLDALGVRDRVTFTRLDPFYQAVYPDFRMDVAAGLEEFTEAHAERFPQERRGIKKFLRACTRLNREIRTLPPEAPLAAVLEDPDRFPEHHRLRQATVADVLEEFVADHRCHAALTTMWTFMGLPPSRLAFVLWAPMLVSFLHAGAFYSDGGMHRLPEAFVAGLTAAGGEFLARAPVRRILVEDGRVRGVRLENGQRIAAPIVVSNADALQTFHELVGSEHLPVDFSGDLARLRPSMSAAVAYLATDLDLRPGDDLAAEMFVFANWNHDDNYRRVLEGTPDAFHLSVPTLVDPSLAPEGEHLVIATTLVPYELGDSWRVMKPRLQQQLLDRVEEQIPGIGERLTFAEGGSPRTMERYTLNTLGALFGWEQSPEQAGINRLSRVGPVDGLYLAGHWTQPGGGIVSVIVSGMQTAQLILGQSDPRALLQNL